METSLKSAYDQYKEQGGPDIAFSTFKKLKPRRVLPFTSHKFRECLCEYCVDVDLKLTVLNSHLSKYPHLKIQDHFEASRLTLCPKHDGQCKKVCLDRQCHDCGLSLLEDHLTPALHDETLCYSLVTWWKWENVAFNATSSRLTKVRKETSFKDLIEDLKVDLTPFSRHLLNAKWQFQQYRSVTSDVPGNTVIVCMDYAENYASRQQDAPQGFHWNNIQTTLHPVVVTYICTEPECEQIVTDSIVFVSNDLTHDHHGVQHFLAKSVELLLGECVVFSCIIAFSDGAPTQYKNRIGFVDCSHALSDLGIKTERHFFGSRHGKGPCDREIGVIKKCVNRAAAANQADVPSAKEFYNFCTKRLSLPRQGTDHSHTKRRFMYVDVADVNRNRPERTQTKALKDTHKIHCVKGVQPFVVSSRERSCFCNGCRGDGICEHQDLTGPWTVTHLRPPKRRNRNNL